MGFRRLHLWGRQTGVALLAVSLTSPAFGQMDDGVVFVGDVDPAAVAESAGPQLPTLTPARTSAASRGSAPAMSSGDPRYVSDQGPMTRPLASATPTSLPKTAVRADYARAANKEIQQAANKREKKSLFKRLMPGFGRKDKESKPTQQASAPKLPAAFNRGVQQAAFRPTPTTANGQGTTTNRPSGIITTPGAREHTGLFEGGFFSSKSGGTSNTSSNSQKFASSKRRVKPSSTQQPTQPARTQPARRQIASSAGIREPLRGETARMPRKTPPKMIAEASAPRKLTAPAESAVPASDGVVFVGDQMPKLTSSSIPEVTPEEKLPRPVLVPPAMQGVAPLPATQTAGPSRPLQPVDSTPVIITNPAVVAKATPTAPATPKPAATEEPKPMASPAPLPKPSSVANAKPLETNPVPKPVVERGPSPRAVALLTEANHFAQLAKTEMEYSNVVQRCRHVLAIDNSPEVVTYSRELASWALNKRGELRADAGQNTEAMNDFSDALSMDPKRWRAVHNRGVLLAQSGAYAEAFDAFNETLALNPEFAKAYSNRASLYVQAGDFNAAMKDYASAISHDPDLAIAHKGQGRVCHMLGMMEQSLRHLDAAVVLAPQDASAAVARADLLVDMGRYAAAEQSYRRAISLDTQTAEAYRNLAWLQSTCPDRRFQNTAEAVANAQRALEIAGVEDDISLDTLAAAQAAGGDFTTAVATLRRAMELAPAGDQSVYAERLAMYQSGRPFTSEPVGNIQQAGYDRAFK